MYSDGEDNQKLHAMNLKEDYSLKYLEQSESIFSGESEFPNTKDSLHIKWIYDKNKFIHCPDNISKICKEFYQHDLDKIVLCDKFSKSVFEKAWNEELSSDPILPCDFDSNVNALKIKLSLYNWIPKYNSPIVNRQCCPRFSVPLNGSLSIPKEQVNSQTLLLFNSRFESGNLEKAYKIEEIYKVAELSIRKSGMSKYQTSGLRSHFRQRNWTSQSMTKLEARYDLFLTPDWSIGKTKQKQSPKI